MSGGEVGGCGCAVGERTIDAPRVGTVCGLEVGKRRFQRESVGVQPGEESGSAEYAGVGVLRGVYVGVFCSNGN